MSQSECYTVKLPATTVGKHPSPLLTECEKKLQDFKDLEDYQHQQVLFLMKDELTRTLNSPLTPRSDDDTWIRFPIRRDTPKSTSGSSDSSLKLSESESLLDSSEDEWRPALQATLEFCNSSLERTPSTQHVNAASSFFQRFTVLTSRKPDSETAESASRGAEFSTRLQAYVALTTLKEYLQQKYRKIQEKFGGHSAQR